MAASNSPITLKLTLVGDGGIGKSCLILQYLYGDFVEEYEPTKADAYRRDITLQGEEVRIDILDTAGQEDYPAMRDRYLKHGDGFLLLFDLTNRETFDSLNRYRENILRVKSDLVNLPIVLVGNKKDLTENRQVKSDEAASLAAKWNIIYLETSAKTRENVDRAFSEILIKIKEAKTSRIRVENNNGNSFGSNNIGSNSIRSPPQINPTKNISLTEKEDRELREYSAKKRAKKFYQNFKKKCIIQ